jgi:hypothetical protein
MNLHLAISLMSLVGCDNAHACLARRGCVAIGGQPRSSGSWPGAVGGGRGGARGPMPTSARTRAGDRRSEATRTRSSGSVAISTRRMGPSQRGHVM